MKGGKVMNNNMKYAVLVELANCTQFEDIFDSLTDAMECAVKYMRQYVESLYTIEVNAIEDVGNEDYNDLYNVFYIDVTDEIM